MKSQTKGLDLIAKSKWVRAETLRVHQRAADTRVASSLSAVEILTALYYGGLLHFDPRQPFAENRDRLVISKGHGSIAMYPILADLGFFSPTELERVCQLGSFLGGIPDPIVPGFETVNGSLGHGLGVACGMALGLKVKKSEARVVVLAGDGEMNEGSIWEAVMFAAHHRIDNLTLIVDKNQKCMLDYTRNVLSLEPLAAKFLAFDWYVKSVDGHNPDAVCEQLKLLQAESGKKPRVLIAETIKGKGVAKLEQSPLCHVTGLSKDEIDQAIAEIEK